MPVLRLMTFLSLRLGRRISRWVLYPISAYFVLFAPTAKRASKDFLRRTLGRPARIADGFRHVLTFASVVHDRVYWLRGRYDLFDVRVRGESPLQALRAQNRGIVFVGGHYGSFEALRVLGDRHGIDARMVMYPDNARMVNAALAAINPALGDSVIALGRPDSLIRVRQHLAEGGCVGLLADRNLGSEGARILDFLGQPAPFPIGPFRLAAMLKAPVVFMAGIYQGGNRFDLSFDTVADFGSVSVTQRDAVMYAAQDRYVELLQEHCRANPWNWFNFYDFWNASP